MQFNMMLWTSLANKKKLPDENYRIPDSYRIVNIRPESGSDRISGTSLIHTVIEVLIFSKHIAK